MRYAFKILCFLCVTITACSKAEKSSINDTHIQPEQYQIYGNSKTVESKRTSSPDEASISEEPKQNKASYLDGKATLLSFISLAIALIGIVGFVRVTSKIKRLRGRVSEYERKQQSFNSGIRQTSTANVSYREIDRLVNNILDKRLDVIVDRVLECLRLNEQEVRKPDSLNSARPKLSNKIMYASSADVKSNSFYLVTEIPDEDTIYELEIDSNGKTATFYVYKEAYSKVLNCSDFLECASDLAKIGNNSVLTSTHGIARKQPDGKWTVDQKAKVIFE